MQQREAARLRRELDGVKVRRGPCFSRELKERVSAWLAEQRAAGATISELASELGLSMGTVLKWSSAREPRTRALVPVQILSEPVDVDLMSVVSPAGFRVEGLSFTEVVALLKALG